MNSETDALRLIHESLSSNGDTTVLSNCYRKWAEHYDADLQSEKYAAPELMVEKLNQYLCQSNDFADGLGSLHIVDAGCGTGLVGSALAQKGFENIDGFDLSDEMAVKAQQTGDYKNVSGGLDLASAKEQLPAQSYDIAISCGVFTPGHVEPIQVKNILPLVKKGGLVMISARVGYDNDYGFGRCMNELELQGALKILTCMSNYPYTSDENANYYLMQKQ